jgi:TolA-binding protein
MKRRPDDPDRDPLLDFLGEQLREAEPRPDPFMERGWRPARRKIAALVASVIVIATGAVLVYSGVLRGPSGSGSRVAVQEASTARETIRARVALLDGDVVLMRSGRRVILSGTDEVRAGDTLESSTGAAVGLAFADGTALVLEGAGRVNVRRVDDAGVRVGLVYGTLAGRVPPESRERAPLTITGSNAMLTVRGTVFSVTADRGRLTGAAVSEGEVEVTNTWTDRSFRVARSERIDMNSWSLSPGSPDPAALQRLARITGGVEIEELEQVEEAPPEVEERPLSISERIQKALDRGDLDAALKLADKHRGSKSIAFNMSAGEAYRRAGKWSDAIEVYLVAGQAGSGKRSEKAMLRAAEIALRKQKKPSSAAKIIDAYLARFPSGWHLDEALYIGGVSNSRSGSYKKARKQFEAYIMKYPEGTQALQVHFLLAKILTRKLSACSSAQKHVQIVKTKAAGTSMAAEADKLAAECKKGGSP